jgi:hypothetical protein
VETENADSPENQITPSKNRSAPPIFKAEYSMTRSKRLWIATIITASLIPTLYISARSIASIQQGYSWSEMDWDQDGNTSLTEFISASDIGRREIKKSKIACTEYYNYKDGLGIKTTCPNNP